LTQIQNNINYAIQYKSVASDKVDRLERTQSSIEKEITLHEEAVKLCTYVLEARTDLLVHIEDMITSMIQASFDVGYKFRIDKTYKVDGSTISGVKFVVTFEDGEPEDVLDNGGGMQNLISFGLRLAFTLLQDELSPVIILDEPWVNLSSIEPVVNFINELNKEVDIQVIIVTHKEPDAQLEAATYRLKKKAGGITQVEVIE